MEINVDRQHKVAVLHCAGSLDADTVARFKQVTQALVDEGVSRFVVEGAQLDFIDSTGLGALVSLLRRIKGEQGEVKMAALTPDVYSIFEITRLNRVFECCTSTDDACRRFQ